MVYDFSTYLYQAFPDNIISNIAHRNTAREVLPKHYPDIHTRISREAMYVIDLVKLADKPPAVSGDPQYFNLWFSAVVDLASRFSTMVPGTENEYDMCRVRGVLRDYFNAHPGIYKKTRDFYQDGDDWSHR